jgi:hypothetical protein
VDEQRGTKGDTPEEHRKNVTKELQRAFSFFFLDLSPSHYTNLRHKNEQGTENRKKGQNSRTKSEKGLKNPTMTAATAQPEESDSSKKKKKKQMK